jgi:hypothetical protein
MATATVSRPRAISGIFRLEDNVAASDSVFWSCLVLASPLADLFLKLQEARGARTPAHP